MKLPWDAWEGAVADVLFDLAQGEGGKREPDVLEAALGYVADHLIADGVVSALVFEHPGAGNGHIGAGEIVEAALHGLWQRSFGPMSEDELQAALAAALLYHKRQPTPTPRQIELVDARERTHGRG